MVVLMFGPPGSGKGTQARRLSQWLGVSTIATGDLLRAEAAAGTELGRELALLLASGQFASDEHVNRIVQARMARISGDGVILDGYPRTVNQARFLEQLLSERGLGTPYILHLDVPAEVIVERLSTRRHCASCGLVYNLLVHLPKVAGICDGCGAGLSVRHDDESVVIRRRLQDYCDQTGPVLAHYTSNCFTIDGNRQPDEVFRMAQDILDPNKTRRNGLH
ncbi:MAG: nucleoside monophosphate kinase [Acidobacteriia bacterium]|nr:nucleoside monophosphate kinase [Terriglobia bacterium]